MEINPFEELERSLCLFKKKGHTNVTLSISEFESLINVIKNQQKEIDYLREANAINSEVNQSMNEEILRVQAELIESYETQVRGMVYGGQLEWVKKRIQDLISQ